MNIMINFILVHLSRSKYTFLSVSYRYIYNAVNCFVSFLFCFVVNRPINYLHSEIYCIQSIHILLKEIFPVLVFFSWFIHEVNKV